MFVYCTDKKLIYNLCVSPFGGFFWVEKFSYYEDTRMVTKFSLHCYIDGSVINLLEPQLVPSAVDYYQFTSNCSFRLSVEEEYVYYEFRDKYQHRIKKIILNKNKVDKIEDCKYPELEQDYDDGLVVIKPFSRQPDWDSWDFPLSTANDFYIGRNKGSFTRNIDIVGHCNRSLYFELMKRLPCNNPHIRNMLVRFSKEDKSCNAFIFDMNGNFKAYAIPSKGIVVKCVINYEETIAAFQELSKIYFIDVE